MCDNNVTNAMTQTMPTECSLSYLLAACQDNSCGPDDKVIAAMAAHVRMGLSIAPCMTTSARWKIQMSVAAMTVQQRVFQRSAWQTKAMRVGQTTEANAQLVARAQMDPSTAPGGTTLAQIQMTAVATPILQTVFRVNVSSSNV